MKNYSLTHGENGVAPSLFPVTPAIVHGLGNPEADTRKSNEHGTDERAVHNNLTQGPAKPESTEQPKRSRARLTFKEGSDLAPPAGFSNRESWMAAVWLNNLAEGGARVQGQLIDLPPSEQNEIRRWFHHRWQDVRRNIAPDWVRDGLVGIGSLWRVKWEEVAAHYRRCPWADVIQQAFANARQAGLPVDRSRETVNRRRHAIARYVGRPLTSCRELSAFEWQIVGEAIEDGELRW